MGLRNIHIGIMLLLFSSASCQFSSLELGISKNFRMVIPGIGFDPGGNGAAFRAKGNFDLCESYQVQAGGEIGANGIANYIAATLGISRSFDLPSEKFSFSCAVRTQQGLALFYPSGMYMFGISEENTVYFKTKRGNRIGLFIELRYLSSPGYTRISQVNSYIDLQSGISFSFL